MLKNEKRARIGKLIFKAKIWKQPWEKKKAQWCVAHVWYETKAKVDLK